MNVKKLKWVVQRGLEEELRERGSHDGGDMRCALKKANWSVTMIPLPCFLSSA